MGTQLRRAEVGRVRTLLAATAALLVAPLLVAAPPAAEAAPTGYVELSDGTSIAVSVHHPEGYDGTPGPVVFEMSGYDGGSASGQTIIGDAEDDTGVPLSETGLPLTRADDSRQNTRMFTEAGYTVVHASVRGSGCSGGEFDLFSWRTALDGREIIEWIAEQPFSDGRVGLTGHSYGGITAFMVAATQPEPLRAVVVSGLIDDLYRGIVYPGGVSNYGFPLLWAGGIRNVYDVAGGFAPGVTRTQDEQCLANAATKRRTVLDDPILQGLNDTDSEWFRSRSLIRYADRIDVPIHIWGAFQDQETGPRGPAHLFEAVDGVPKRLVLSNGFHDGWLRMPEVVADKVHWMNHFVGVERRGFGPFQRGVAHPGYHTSALTLYEVNDVEEEGAHRHNGLTFSREYPHETTRWEELHLRGDGRLTSEPAGPDEGTTSYVSGSLRQSWLYEAGTTAGAPATTVDGPDQATFVTDPVDRDRPLAGPLTATLHLSSTEPDPELFVGVVDLAPDGTRTYVQRGLLRASHRAIDPARSDRLDDGRIYRPHRPHTNPTQVPPGQVEEYLIEVFPAGHVVREGHRLALEVLAPPLTDSFYVYVPRRVPGALATIHHDADHPSRLLVPWADERRVRLGDPVPCERQQQVRCVRPHATPADELPPPFDAVTEELPIGDVLDAFAEGLPGEEVVGPLGDGVSDALGSLPHERLPELPALGTPTP